MTGLGIGRSANSEGFRLGKSAFQPVTLFDVHRQRAQRAAIAPLPHSDQVQPGNLSPRRIARMGRAARLLLLAAREAIASSGLENPAKVYPLPVVVATTSAGMESGIEFFRGTTSITASRRRQIACSDDYFAGRHLRDLAEDLGICGAFTCLANACASGGNAIGHAWELLRAGRAECVLAGGYDALNQLVFAGFDSLQALSTTECRPFDQDRDGLGLGEGSAMLLLESLEHARARSCRIFAEISGYALSTDLHHLTQPHPQGTAALASMRGACATAGITPSQVGYINAHGTGTVLNDLAETHAINAWAGEHSDRIQVSSTKSSVGHLLGAAGAVEAAVCVMALSEQWIPPTCSLRNPLAEAQFPIVREPTPANELEFALSNSFGFGGSNASLLLRRWHD